MATVARKIIAGVPELAEATPSKVLNTKGLVCPYPAFETAKLAGSSDPEEILEIISDDKYTASSSIASVLKQRKYGYVVIDNDDSTYSVIAKKN